MLVSQWLEDHDYVTSLWTLREEGGLHDREAEYRRKQSRGLTAAILEGNWETVNNMAEKNKSFKQNKAFQYAIARQQYLEIVASKNSQKALTFILHRLKPLEQFAPEREFYALSYLLTCKHVHDAPQFRGWEESAGRQRIIRDHRDVLSIDDGRTSQHSVVQMCSTQRLDELLRQACAYQALAARREDIGGPIQVTSLLQDYTHQVIPACMISQFSHAPRTRAVTFAGSDDSLIVCGGPDGDAMAWNIRDGEKTCMKGVGSSGKIWALDGNSSLICAACADGKIRFWDTTNGSTVRLTASANTGDTYACAFSPGGPWVLAGGFDRTVALVDVNSGIVVRAFSGPTQAITSVTTNATGNLVVAGSKDGKVKFFDVSSGVCVQTISDPVAATAISSLAFSPDGATLAVSEMNSTVAIWDLATARMRTPRLKGHVNIHRNFIRMCYGSSSDVIYSGSEDGKVVAWSSDGGVLAMLPHSGEVVFDLRWSKRLNMLATCAVDGLIRLWKP